MSTGPDPIAQRASLGRLEAIERQKSALLAAELRVAAQIGELWGDDDGVVLEVAGTARVGQGRAGTTLSRGERMVELFPIALGLLESGAMRVGTVDIVLYVSRNASRAVQAELDRRCSEQVCRLDAADARKLLARSVLEIEADLDAEEQRLRHERALADRFVSISPTQDGMARITADLGVLEARRFGLDLEELVRAQKVVDDKNGIVRTQAQRRADVLARLPSIALAIAHAAQQGRLADLLPDALLAAVPAPRTSPELDLPDPALLGMDELPLDLPARVERPCWKRDTDSLVGELLSLPVRNPVTMHVHTAMTTQLELDQRAGWLEGIGPISAMHSRLLLPGADLRRVAVDERTGVPLGIDIPPNTPWFDTCTWTFETDDAPDGHAPPDPTCGDDPGGGDGGPDPAPDTGPLHDPDERAVGAVDEAEVTGPPDPRPEQQRPRQAPSTEAARQRARLLNLLRPMYLTHAAEPQHDPSAGLRTFAQVRDMACDGPGCPRTAQASELDHEQDYALGGVTAAWNLKHRSTRCHHSKHRDWTVIHHRATGASTWTSPLGCVYERAAFWPTPTRLAPDAALPRPRLEPPLTVSREHQYDDDLPLWFEPVRRGTRHARVVALADLPDPDRKPPKPGSLAAQIAATRAKITAAFPPGTEWSKGPPPF